MVKHIERAPAHTIPFIREFPLIGSLPALMRRDCLTFLLRLLNHQNRRRATLW